MYSGVLRDLSSPTDRSVFSSSSGIGSSSRDSIFSYAIESLVVVAF